VPWGDSGKEITSEPFSWDIGLSYGADVGVATKRYTVIMNGCCDASSPQLCYMKYRDQARMELN